MSQVTVTFTFDSTDAAAAFLAGKSLPVVASEAEAPAPAPKATRTKKEAAPAVETPVASEPTVSEEADDVQPTKELDFDADVMPALKALSTKDKAAFGALMKRLGFAKAADVQAKPATWAEIVAAAA